MNELEFHFWGTELPANHVDTVWAYRNQANIQRVLPGHPWHKNPSSIKRGWVPTMMRAASRGRSKHTPWITRSARATGRSRR
jgi:hypothetical protein